MARVNVTRIWVIIDLCLHPGDVGNEIFERGAFAEMRGACCTDCCTVCQPRIESISGEPTDESFQCSGSGIVVPPERRESIWRRNGPGTGADLANWRSLEAKRKSS